LETGETRERRLLHKDGEAERFYRDLKLGGVSVGVGIEATGHARWFERLLAELGLELLPSFPGSQRCACPFSIYPPSTTGVGQRVTARNSTKKVANNYR
jgi:hypothetical protein